MVSDETPKFIWANENEDHAPDGTFEQGMGYRITLARESAGLSIDQLADATSLGVADLRAYEAGTVRVPPAALIELCRKLECNIDELLPPPPAAHSH